MECHMQGSILGPLLFLIYVNDINKGITHGKIVSYADDTTITVNSSCIEDVYIYAYENMTSIIDWFNANKLSVNLSKTNYMLFSSKKVEERDIAVININNVTIEKVSEAKFLGIHIDDKLTWNTQVNTVTNKLKQALYFLNATKKFIPDRNRTMLYNAHVQSHLNYGTMVWGTMLNNTQTCKVCKYQNKIMNTFKCLKQFKTLDKCYRNLRILKFNDLIDFELAKFMFNIKTSQLAKPLLHLLENSTINRSHNYNTRNRNIPNIAKHSIKAFNISFLNKSYIIWTKLNNFVKSALNIKTFKQKFKKQKLSSY